MTGINASKIIQNLQFLNNFASMFADVAVNLASERCAGFERSSMETSRLEKRKKENPSWFSVGLFFFSEIGSGAYGHHPLIGGGGGRLESQPVLNTAVSSLCLG